MLDASRPNPRKRLLTAMVLGGVLSAASPATAFRILYYNKSPSGAAYVHTSAIAALKDSVLAWGKAYGFDVDVGADASVFSAANLARYRTVVFDNVSSETADALPQASQRAALLDWIRTGGFVGIHAAAEAGRWPDLVSLIGAKMTVHTSETNELTAVLNADASSQSHPMLAGLPAKVSLKDEWYSYTASPRSLAGVKILYTLDEKTFQPAAVMGDHPIAWAREMSGGGRMFYTGMGHTAPYLAQPFIRSLLINAIMWTAGETGTGLAGGGPPIRGLLAAEATAPGRLTVRAGAWASGGAWRAEVRDLKGTWVAVASGLGADRVEFRGLRPGTYLVKVVSASGRASRLAVAR